MKLYRYLSEEELEHIKANEIDKIGSVYNDKKSYKRINTHNYKKDVKYLHFYFDKREISRIEKLGFQGSKICYICEFEIPFYVIFSHIGTGRYDCQGYAVPYETVYEVALPAKKMKSKYLKSFEKDKNSGPIDFGPIIKFDKRLYEPMYFNEQEQEETDNVPFKIKTLNKNQNIIEEKGLE